MSSKLIYLRDSLFANLTLEQRKEFVKGQGIEEWNKMLEEEDIYMDERDYELYSLFRFEVEFNLLGKKKKVSQVWLGENMRYNCKGSVLNPDNPNLL